MVKFRCLRCSQKIAVNDAGIGVEIDCPTCAERLIVPPATDHEFHNEPANTAAFSTPITGSTKDALLPHLARLMMNRFVQVVLLQRRELLRTQDATVDEIDALEQRVALLQAKMHQRMNYFGERVAQLQAELAAKDAENHELRLRIRELAVIPMQHEMPPRPARGKLPNSVLVGA